MSFQGTNGQAKEQTMLDEPDKRSWITTALNLFLLVLALFGCGLFGWSLSLLRPVPPPSHAPLACAHTVSQPPGAAPPEELFVGVTSAVGNYTTGLHRFQVTTDANTALCVV